MYSDAMNKFTRAAKGVIDHVNLRQVVRPEWLSPRSLPPTRGVIRLWMGIGSQRDEGPRAIALS